MTNNFKIRFELPPLGRRNIPLNKVKFQLLREIFNQEVANPYAEREDFADFPLGFVLLTYERRVLSGRFIPTDGLRLEPYFQKIGFVKNHARDLWRHIAADLAQPIIETLADESEAIAAYIPQYLGLSGAEESRPLAFYTYLLMNFYTGWTWAECEELAITSNYTLANLNPIPDSYAQQYWTD